MNRFSPRNRTPRGTSAGGQFAATPKDEPALTLNAQYAQEFVSEQMDPEIPGFYGTVLTDEEVRDLPSKDRKNYVLRTLQASDLAAMDDRTFDSVVREQFINQEALRQFVTDKSQQPKRRILVMENNHHLIVREVNDIMNDPTESRRVRQMAYGALGAQYDMAWHMKAGTRWDKMMNALPWVK